MDHSEPIFYQVIIFFLKPLQIQKLFLSLQNNKQHLHMAYTKKALVIKEPSKKLRNLISELRENKQAQLKKLRDQSQCTFQIHL